MPQNFLPFAYLVTLVNEIVRSRSRVCEKLCPEGTGQERHRRGPSHFRALPRKLGQSPLTVTRSRRSLRSRRARPAGAYWCRWRCGRRRRPRGQKRRRTDSLQPLITAGCWVNSGVQLTTPRILTTRPMRSKLPRALRSEAKMFSPANWAALAPAGDVQIGANPAGHQLAGGIRGQMARGVHQIPGHDEDL